MTSPIRPPSLEIARRLIALGLSVFPVPRPRPGVAVGQPGDGKVPAIKWKPFQDHLASDDELVSLFSIESNIAIVTGTISGIVVVDADDRPALRWAVRKLPYTPWQVQTSRGFHLYYRYPEGRVANRARIETGDGRLALDVRGDSGYVIAPGSVHATGAVYAFAGDWQKPRAEVPTFWPGWLQRPSRPPTPPPRATRPTGDVVERARRYLAAIPLPIIGAGSDSQCLYAACRLVRGFGLCAADTETLLWEWAGGRPGWTREWITRKVDHAAKYGTEPIGALR